MDLRPVSDIEYDTLDDLLSDVIIDCPGVNPALAMRRLQEAHYQFCKETQAWRALADRIQLQKNIRSYDISTPDDVVIDRLYFLEGEGNVIPPAPLQYVQESSVRAYVQNARDNISLLFDPSGPADPNNLRVEDFLWPRIILLPAPNTNIIDCRLNEDWGFRISSGAKWKLMISPKKDYSSADGALYHRQEYYRGMLDCRMDVNRNGSNASLSVHMSRWTMGSNPSTSGWGLRDGINARF